MDAHALPGRRRLLRWTALASLGAITGLPALAGLSGCAKDADAGAPPAPAEFDRTTSCGLDGMLLADYPGPKAQVHYADQKKPVFFCDTVELFSTLLAGEQARQVRAAYVQDMASADWDAPHGHWIDARTAWYVFGSKRRGSMGPTIASLATRSDADQFAATYGGRVLRFGEITADMADLCGGAQHDTRM